MITIEPEYYIHIGIKDGNIVVVDWREMSQEFSELDLDTKAIHRTVKDYLKQAVRFLKGRSGS